MTTLTKEEVISQLQMALETQSGKAVSIEQAGSWYKIDGGKSVRFSELETMHGELCAASPASSAKAVVKAQVKPAKMQPSKKATATSDGLTPKQLWRQKLANTAGSQTLPRGF
ncbi:hypothetical protein [Shewanella phaeophyticola]|uniref:Uncharacterized protein n=1 Tax=Shewanella phaeophyticola TaxID=2978345 RepID=A0ABT2P285_9GAMM|nr:hypothetical protein [Shewanella sp. KJ10-1]MCT8986761.1 hypothetical protein [Shewanella sp. KJ10-1]